MELSALLTLSPVGALAAAVAIAAALGATMLALHARARRERQLLAAALAEARHHAAAAELATAGLRSELASLRHQLEQLEYRQERQATAGSHAGFRQAIALCRHGASARELVDSCGLSEGEAQLVHSLYGRAPAGQAQEADLH